MLGIDHRSGRAGDFPSPACTAPCPTTEVYVVVGAHTSRGSSLSLHIIFAVCLECRLRPLAYPKFIHYTFLAIAHRPIYSFRHPSAPPLRRSRAVPERPEYLHLVCIFARTRVPEPQSFSSGPPPPASFRGIAVRCSTLGLESFGSPAIFASTADGKPTANGKSR
jgi:hypothetical protein